MFEIMLALCVVLWIASGVVGAFIFYKHNANKILQKRDLLIGDIFEPEFVFTLIFIFIFGIIGLMSSVYIRYGDFIIKKRPDADDD